MMGDFDFPDEAESFGTNPEDFAVGEDGTVSIGGIRVAGGGGFDNTDPTKVEFSQGRFTADEREEQAAAVREAAGDLEEADEEPAAARRTPVVGSHINPQGGFHAEPRRSGLRFPD